MLVHYEYSSIYAASNSSAFFSLIQHQQWNRLRGTPGAILFEVNVLPNQAVNFSKKSLHLLDSDGNILTTYVANTLFIRDKFSTICFFL